MLTVYSKKIQRFYVNMKKTNSSNILSAFLLLTLVLSSPSWAEDLSDEDSFIVTGTVSYSKKYILAEDFSHIVFKIKNHNPKTMAQLFGWVYRNPVTKEETSKKSKKLVLVNNPHRGGLLVRDGPHRPGKTALWRFVLDRNMEGATEKDKFLLRVSPKSVFFQRMEPPPLKNSKKKKDK